ncbi:MAG: hypothetical protein PHH43_07835 [Candidatus Cloacimonetes bacterium]|nr:hypothetical protein [Candidatus Cloacimonadota bacterium]
MKHLLLVTASLIVAIVLTEFVVNVAIGYPKYMFGRRTYKLQRNLGQYAQLIWNPPYYGRWNVEGRNKTVRYNNLGLPGPNIVNQISSKHCLLLGDSYVEALQYSGDITAAGVFSSELKKNKSRYQVVNLGSSAHDPYILWFRLKFFEKYFSPDRIVLIYERFDTMKRYFGRWELPLDFAIQNSFGVQIVLKNPNTIAHKLRSSSSALNLMATLKAKKSKNTNELSISDYSVTLENEAVYDMLVSCLKKYYEEYGDKFVFVSLMGDNPYKRELYEFCHDQGINYFTNYNVMNPSNLIDGTGHLNEKGNMLLGQYMFSLLREGKYLD